MGFPGSPKEATGDSGRRECPSIPAFSSVFLSPPVSQAAQKPGIDMDLAECY